MISSFKQMGFFKRVPPTAVYGHNPDKSATIQTQARIYCSCCGAFLGCGVMISKRLSIEEIREAAKHEFIRPVPFFDLTEDGRCLKCGALCAGTGANGIPNTKDKYWPF